MINIINYEIFPEDVDYSLPSVFLAGPTVRGNQPHLISWRSNSIEEFHKQEFEGNLIIPEFASKTESDQVRYDIPLWEFDGLKRCDCIMFWVPRTRELIGLTTNYELGYWVAREREKVVYGRPKDAYRVSYLDIMWVEDMKDRFKKNSGVPIYRVPIYMNLGKTVAAAIQLAYKRHSERF
jgi:nucleoside 2-deoxyribosyltransferase